MEMIEVGNWNHESQLEDDGKSNWEDGKKEECFDKIHCLCLLAGEMVSCMRMDIRMIAWKIKRNERKEMRVGKK